MVIIVLKRHNFQLRIVSIVKNWLLCDKPHLYNSISKTRVHDINEILKENSTTRCEILELIF